MNHIRIEIVPWNVFLDQFHVDWSLSFDDEGTSTCTANSFMTGFKRSDGGGLNCIEEAVCGPLPITYSESALTCKNGWWWDSFAT